MCTLDCIFQSNESAPRIFGSPERPSDFEQNYYPTSMAAKLATISLYGFVLFVGAGLATPIIYDGRAPLNYSQFDLDKSVDPYLT